MFGSKIKKKEVLIINGNAVNVTDAYSQDDEWILTLKNQYGASSKISQTDLEDFVNTGKKPKRKWF